MHKRPISPHLLMSNMYDPVETPAGLIVSSRSIEPLIKAETSRREKEKNQSAFFSKMAMGSNMVAYGAREKPQGTPSFDMLREAAKKSFLDAIIIRARVDQMKRIWQRDASGKDVGFQVVHQRYKDPEFKGSAEIDDRCREMEAIIADPTPVKYTYLYPHNIRPHPGLKDLIARLTKAELIIDRQVIQRYKRRDGQGYSAFHWLPGDTIKPVDESIREWAKKNEQNGKVQRDTVYKMSIATGFDLAQAAYVQMTDGMISAAYADDEIAVHITNPSDELNRFGYGESRLELSLDVTATLIYAWNYNRELFKTNYPEQILAVIGDYDKDGLAAFKQQVLGENGPGSNWRLPVIPFATKEEANIQSVKLRESPKDMLFDQLLRISAMFKLAAYGAHASTLNLGTDSGGGASPLFGGDKGAEIEFSKELSFIPAIHDLCEFFTDSLIKPRYDDLQLVVNGLNPEDEKSVVDLRTSRVSKWITKNEARQEEGREPIGDVEDPKNPWNYPSDVPCTNYMSVFQMLEQGSQQQEEEPIEKSHKEVTKFLNITLED